MASKRPPLLRAAIDSVLRRDDLWGPDGLMPARFEPGNAATKLLVITGQNASGKSLIAKIISARIAATRKTTKGSPEGVTYNIGMALRTMGGGISGKTFVYGDESDQSTGSTSVRAVNGAISNTKRSTNPVVVIFDEPEIGLSDEYALAMAEKIAAFEAELPPICDGLMVVTHNRAIVRRLLASDPHRLRLGTHTTSEWLDQPITAASVAEIDALQDQNHRTWLAIRKLMR